MALCGVHLQLTVNELINGLAWLWPCRISIIRNNLNELFNGPVWFCHVELLAEEINELVNVSVWHCHVELLAAILNELFSGLV